MQHSNYSYLMVATKKKIVGESRCYLMDHEEKKEVKEVTQHWLCLGLRYEVVIDKEELTLRPKQNSWRPPGSGKQALQIPLNAMIALICEVSFKNK